MKLHIATAALISGLAFNAISAPVTVSSATGTGSYNNAASLISDGIFPYEGSVWSGSSIVWWNGTATALTLTFDQVYSLQDVTLSVDNNDSYVVQTSLDGMNWTTLFTVSASYGEIDWGMDTMSSVSGESEYVSGLDFQATEALYARILATSGDNLYSVGELTFAGASASAIPEPTSITILGIGLIGLGATRRKKRTKRN